MWQKYRNYYLQNRPLSDRVDLLNHYPCISLSERISPDANKFFQETIKEYTEKEGIFKVSDYLTDSFISELGIRENVLGVHKTSEVTLWKEYCIISELIRSSVSKKHPSHTQCANVVNWILMSPSMEIEDIRKIYRTLNQIPDIVDVRTEKDFFKEIIGTVFDKLLPYKLHAYGLGAKLDAFGSMDSEHIIESGEYNYLEILIRSFMGTLQAMRGQNLSDLKRDMKILTVCIYLFMDFVFDKPWEIGDLQLFKCYIDAMMQYGIGQHIVERVVSMQNSSRDLISIVSGIDFENPMIRKLVNNVNRKKSIRTNTGDMSSSDNALNTSWNGLLLSGSGSFSKLATDQDALDDFCYSVEGLDEDGIRQFIDVPTTVSFQISESDIGYLIDEVKLDVCKICYPGKTKLMQTVIALQGDGTDKKFLLFSIPETKNVYGISLHPSASGGRLIIQFGTEDDYYSYRLSDEKDGVLHA